MRHYGKYAKYQRPKSWSVIARNYADRMINNCEYEITAGRITREDAQNFMQRTISNSVYSSRQWMLKRAAKRLHRKGWI